MRSKYLTGAIVAFAFGALAAGSALAQDTVKIGLIVSMTGQQASLSIGIAATTFRNFCPNALALDKIFDLKIKNATTINGPMNYC
jgi:hypothetical protein